MCLAQNWKFFLNHNSFTSWLQVLLRLIERSVTLRDVEIVGNTLLTSYIKLVLPLERIMDYI